ncbi:hypothetical protein [Burkholderia sp. PAMC 28687]|nr:hypothetical protein [Burkholderia sp. PAMC 28687]
MDVDRLSSKGVVPRDPRVALIEGQAVVLGANAMLLRRSADALTACCLA